MKLSRGILCAMVLFCMGAAVPTFAAARVFVANDYGAKGDGVTLDTAAIQKALDAAGAAHGTVEFRPGVYLTGAIFVRSHTHLKLDKGVTLLASQNLRDYPFLPTRVAGIEMKWPAAVVNVYEQRDVTVNGGGTVDGDGSVWWARFWTTERTYASRGLRWAADYATPRPRTIQIYKSSNVTVRNLLLKRSPFWTVHICYSQHVTVDGVTIRNNIGGKGPSTDGIDIDSSAHVLVEHADIEANDDAICLKSGRDADGLRVNRPTEDVVVRDSVVRVGAAGVTFGSETSGGFRNIQVYRLKVLAGAHFGIYVKSAHTRGGWSKNVRIHDIEMEGVPVAIGVNMNWNPKYSYAQMPADVENNLPPGVTSIPQFWRVMTAPVPADKGLPHFSGFRISRIHATGVRRAFAVAAYPNAPVEHFSLSNITIDCATAGSIQDVKDWSFKNVRVNAADGSHVTFEDAQGVHGQIEYGKP